MNKLPFGRVGCVLTFVLTAVATCAIAAPAQARPLLATTLTVPGAVSDRTCFARELNSGPGVAKLSVRSPGYGLIKVRLVAASGNWELGVFDAKTGRPVAGSAHFGARELAEGLARKGQALLVQACRRSGATRATMTVGFETLDRRAISDVQLVRVSTPTREARQKLLALGFELTEHHGLDFTDVFVRKTDQAAKLGQLGLISVVLTPDVEAQRQKAIYSGGPASLRAAISGLPSARTCPVTGCYRTLAEYTSEMDALASAHPTFVKKITLTPTTYEGRALEGLEITTDVNARDGKPVFLMMGLHHAREWPSGEHTLEWAYELICGYSPDPAGGTDTPCPDSAAAPNPRVVNLLQTARVIVVPVVNPDGFNISRTVGGVDGGNGRGGNELVNILSHPNEYRRKNCRVDAPPPLPPTGNCLGPAFGVGSTGVDPNRNYGTFWGGPGSSHDPIGETYHGPHCPGDNPVEGPSCGPFSEPETEAVRKLISARHVTTLITNHTFTGLVLRAPGLASQGLAVDEPAMKALGDAMAAQNGYVSQYGWQLYDTTGTTEDWSYNTTGGYGYTFEIGPTNFHPPYAEMIQEYDGTATWPDPDPLEGNREAYFLALENTAAPLHHSVVFGSAPAGAVLRLKKTVQTPTSIRDANQAYRTFTDTLDTTMVVPAGGSYTWHINPSTRPLVAKTRGRLATGTPSPSVAFNGSIDGPPADGARPCADFDTPPPSCYNEHPFTLPGAPADNATAAIRIQWTTPASDWDMKIVHDLDGDGTVDAGEPVVGSSGQGTSANEGTSINEGTPGFVLGAKYVVQVINYAAAEAYTGSVEFLGPEPAQIATTESWTFTCEMPEGNVLSTQQLTIGRGNGVPSTPPPFPAPPSPQQRNFNAACAGGPTAVQVAAFAARALERGVAVTWRTANERDIAGFNLWRGRSGASTKVNRTLVPAKRAGGVGTASYRIVDRAGRPGSRPTYLLQVVRRDGTRAWVGSTATKR